MAFVSSFPDHILMELQRLTWVENMEVEEVLRHARAPVKEISCNLYQKQAWRRGADSDGGLSCKFTGKCFRYQGIPPHEIVKNQGISRHCSPQGNECNILICRCMQKHIQHNKDERTQFFRKIYLSLY